MKISIGFIGLGEHQQRAHLKHLLVLKNQGYDLEFVGAFDPREASFLEVRKTYSLDLVAFPSVEALLNQQVNTVFISSPDQFHGEHLLACLNRGCHIFCEKPVAVSLDDISILKKAIRQTSISGAILTTCHPRRFDPPFIWLKENLGWLEKDYGKALSFDFSFWYHEVTDDWKKNRSLLSDHFGHEIDIFRYLFGEWAFKAARVRDSFENYEVLGISENQSFRFFGSRSLAEPVYQETMQVDFQKTRFFININKGIGLFQPSGQEIFLPSMDYDVRFNQVNKNFLDSILGAEIPYLSSNDILCNNLMSVQLTETGKCEWS